MKSPFRRTLLAAAALLAAGLGFAATAQAQYRHDHDRGWHPGPEWNQRIRMRCESDDFRYRFCQVDLGRKGRVELIRQVSNTRCVRGRTWGTNRAGIWVDGGCAADFSVSRRW